MKKSTTPSERVMLLLPLPLVHFVDNLVVQLSPQGFRITRQDAIRQTLYKLQAAVASEQSSQKPSKPSRTSPRKTSAARK